MDSAQDKASSVPRCQMTQRPSLWLCLSLSGPFPKTPNSWLRTVDEKFLEEKQSLLLGPTATLFPLIAGPPGLQLLELKVNKMKSLLVATLQRERHTETADTGAPRTPRYRVTLAQDRGWGLGWALGYKGLGLGLHCTVAVGFGWFL